MSWTRRKKRALPNVSGPLRPVPKAPNANVHITKPGESDSDRLGFSDFDRVFKNYDDETCKVGETTGVGMFGSLDTIVLAAMHRTHRRYEELYVDCSDLDILSAEVKKITRRQREELKAKLTKMVGGQLSPEYEAALVFAQDKLYNAAMRAWYLECVAKNAKLLENKELIRDLQDYDELYGFSPSKLNQVVLDSSNVERSLDELNAARAKFNEVVLYYGPARSEEAPKHGVYVHAIVPFEGTVFLHMPTNDQQQLPEGAPQPEATRVVPENAEGWQWVNLGVSKSKSEGSAMHHCGNHHEPDWDEKDLILSLRKPVGTRGTYCTPALTFIMNQGWLGQMKGSQNEKPVEKYHPYVAALLMDPRIKGIFGGGYNGAGNFAFDDLAEERKKQVKEANASLITAWSTTTIAQKREALRYFPESYWGSQSHGGLRLNRKLIEVLKNPQGAPAASFDSLLNEEKYDDILLFLGESMTKPQQSKLVKHAMENSWSWAAKNLSELMSKEEQAAMVDRVADYGDIEDAFTDYAKLLADPDNKKRYVNKTVTSNSFWYLESGHDSYYESLDDAQKELAMKTAMTEDRVRVARVCWDRVPEAMRPELKRRVREEKGNRWMLQYCSHVLLDTDIDLMVEGFIDGGKKGDLQFLIQTIPQVVPEKLSTSLVKAATKAEIRTAYILNPVVMNEEGNKLKVDDATFKTLVESSLADDSFSPVKLLRKVGGRISGSPELKTLVTDKAVDEYTSSLLEEGQDLLPYFTDVQRKKIINNGVEQEPTTMLRKFKDSMDDTQKKKAVANTIKQDPDFLMREENQFWMDTLDPQQAQDLAFGYVMNDVRSRLATSWTRLDPKKRMDVLREATTNVRSSSDPINYWQGLKDVFSPEERGEGRTLLIDAMLKSTPGRFFETIFDELLDEEKRYAADAIVQKNPVMIFADGGNIEILRRLTPEQKVAATKTLMEQNTKEEEPGSTSSPDKALRSLLSTMNNRPHEITPEQKVEILNWAGTVKVASDYTRSALVEFVSSFDSDARLGSDQAMAAFTTLYKNWPMITIRKFPELATPDQMKKPIMDLAEQGDINAIEWFSGYLEQDANKDLRKAVIKALNASPTPAAPERLLENYYKLLDDEDKRAAVVALLAANKGSVIRKVMKSQPNNNLSDLMSPEQAKDMVKSTLLEMRGPEMVKSELFDKLSEDEQDAIIKTNIDKWPQSIFRDRWETASRNAENKRALLEKLVAQVFEPSKRKKSWLLEQCLTQAPEYLERFPDDLRKKLIDELKTYKTPLEIQERLGTQLRDDEKEALAAPPVAQETAPAPEEAPPAASRARPGRPPAGESIEDALRRDVAGTLENRWDEVPSERIPELLEGLDPVWVFAHLVERMTPEQRIVPVDRMIATGRHREELKALTRTHTAIFTQEQIDRINAEETPPREASADCAYCRKPMRINEDRGVMYCPHCRRELAVEVDRQRYNYDPMRETTGDEVAQQSAPSQYEAKFDMSQYQTRVPGDLF